MPNSEPLILTTDYVDQRIDLHATRVPLQEVTTDHGSTATRPDNRQPITDNSRASAWRQCAAT